MQNAITRKREIIILCWMTKLKINKSLYYIHPPNFARTGLDPCLKGSLIGV